MRDVNDLKRPTIADRVKCNDISRVNVRKDGSMFIEHGYAELVAWACVGLECAEAELEKFSDNEIADIGTRTKELANVPFERV